MNQPSTPPPLPVSATDSAKQAATLVYALQAASFLVGVTVFAAIIVNYIKLDETRGTWVESHFRWQIRTFWFSLLWGVLGVILSVVLVGYLILAANVVWFVYRIVKGWLYLSENRPLYATP